MNPNMNIYKRLNPRLLVQAAVGLGLLHWANMSNISLTISFDREAKFHFGCSVGDYLMTRSFLVASRLLLRDE